MQINRRDPRFPRLGSNWQAAVMRMRMVMFWRELQWRKQNKEDTRGIYFYNKNIVTWLFFSDMDDVLAFTSFCRNLDYIYAAV